MDDLWHYMLQRKQMEPVNSAKLRELAQTGELKPNDLVWQAGLPQWVQADSLTWLFAPAASDFANALTATPVRQPAAAPIEEPLLLAPYEPTGAEITPGRPRTGPQDEDDEKDTRRRRREEDEENSNELRRRRDIEENDGRQRPRKEPMPTGTKLAFAGGGIVAALILLALTIWIVDSLASGPAPVKDGPAKEPALVVRQPQQPLKQLEALVKTPSDEFLLTLPLLRKMVQERETKDVDLRGFFTPHLFRDVPQDGALLIGFDLNVGRSIDGLRPIYMTQKGEVLGPWFPRPVVNPIRVKAKVGYVVARITMRPGRQIDGMAVKFARLAAERLELEDHYTSPWYGLDHGVNPDAIGTEGDLFVGVFGQQLEPTGPPSALGLVAVER